MTIVQVKVALPGQTPFAGFVRVTLTRALVDDAGNMIVPESVDYPLVAGAVNLSLYPTQEENVPYLFEIFKTVVVPADTSVEPNIPGYTEEVLIEDFTATVPDSLQPIALEMLVASNGIYQDNTDASFVALARRLYFSQDFWNALNGQLLRSRGAYSATAFYERGDVVSFDGSSFLCKANTRIQNVPTSDLTSWQLLAAKGANGTGTAGNSTAYNATSWNGATDAPSRGVIRDLVENTLASQANLALKANITGQNLVSATTSTTPASTDNSSKLANTQFVQTLITEVSKALCPVGAIMQWFTDSAPTRWLICDGRAVSRTTYAALFALWGTTYGAGDGSTTFNLPDARGRTMVGRDSTALAGSAGVIASSALGTKTGAENVTLTTAQMPSHIHNTIFYPSSDEAPGFGLSASATFQNRPLVKNSAPVFANASLLEATGSGSAHNNMQPSIIVHHIVYSGV